VTFVNVERLLMNVIYLQRHTFTHPPHILTALPSMYCHSPSLPDTHLLLFGKSSSSAAVDSPSCILERVRVPVLPSRQMVAGWPGGHVARWCSVSGKLPLQYATPKQSFNPV